MIKNNKKRNPNLTSSVRKRLRKNINDAKEDKELIAIKDENKDGYIVLKQESLYRPLLIVFGIFLFVMVVLFPVSIFDTLWPDGMTFFRGIVRWGFFSAIATLLPLPVSVVDANLLTANIFTGDTFTFIYTLSLIIIFDTFFAYIGYKFTRTLRKLFASKSKEKDEKKVNERFQKYGNAAMYVGAATPLPFTLMVYTAGALKLPLKGFLIAVFLGRVTKYALIALPMRLFNFSITDYGSDLLESFMNGDIQLAHYIIMAVIAGLLLWLTVALLKFFKKK